MQVKLVTFVMDTGNLRSGCNLSLNLMIFRSVVIGKNYSLQFHENLLISNYLFIYLFLLNGICLLRVINIIYKDRYICLLVYELCDSSWGKHIDVRL